jgi:hypothetical protein
VIPEHWASAGFRAINGEFGWTRAQALEVVAILADREQAVLGGELWWVPECSPSAQYGMTAL